MTILWWLPEVPPDLGGIGTFAVTVGPELVVRGYPLEFLVSWRGPSTTTVEGIPTRRFPIREAIETGDHREILSLRSAVAAHKRAVSPDLYHVHLCEPSPVLHLSTLAAARAPMVLTLHNEMFQRLHRDGDDTLLLRLANESAVIATVSVGSADDFIARAPQLAHRVVVALNGIMIGDTPEPVPDTPTIAFVGRLVPQKGIDRLIKALPRVRDHVAEVTLVVAGDGPEAASLRQLAHTVGCADVIDFVGMVDHDRVRAIMNEARVIAIPSRFEGLPYVALEAGERGRAVVGTRIGGLVDAVIPGVTGILVDQTDLDDDPSALADALIEVLAGPGVAERQGEAARQRVSQHLSVGACADIYSTVYRVARTDRAPRVSIIIPAWNAAHLIGATLATVASQTFTDYEVIVVDDGSTDDTLGVVRSQMPTAVTLPQPHRGIGASRNAGIAICRGELIAHLDADDLWPDDRLEQLVAAYDAADGVEAVFGRAVEFADADAPPNAVVVAEPQVVRILTTGVVSRLAQRHHGPLARVPAGDMIEWIGRALINELSYKQIDAIVLQRRIHANNNSLQHPFMRDTARIGLLRNLLHERRLRQPADPDQTNPSTAG